MRVIEGSSSGKRDLNKLIDEIADSIPDKNLLLRDVNKYLAVDVRELPQFTEDGNIAFYEIGGVLLCRLSLIRFIEQCR